MILVKNFFFLLQFICDIIILEDGSDIMDDYLVKIDDFEGPLDLLLHLVKVANIDIKDINICDITNQYLEYIHKWEELNIEVASSYLVMAATLMEIKSSSLLPIEKSDNVDDEEVVETRDTLIQKLIEYEKYKEVTKDFKKLEEERKEIYTKSPEKLNELLHQKIVNDTGVTVDDLRLAMEEFLKRKNMEKPIATRVTNKEYSVKMRKEDIKKLLSEKKKILFTDLFQKYNKSYVVVTFLAVLELAKESNIILRQDDTFGSITIEGCA